MKCFLIFLLYVQLGGLIKDTKACKRESPKKGKLFIEYYILLINNSLYGGNINILYICPFSHAMNISPELILASRIGDFHKVYFLTVKKSHQEVTSSIKKVVPPTNINYIYMDNIFLFKKIAYPIINIMRVYLVIKKILKSEKIDIIHIFLPEHLICLPVLFFKYNYNIPLITSVNAIPGIDWFYGNTVVDKIGKLYFKLISRRIINKSDEILPYSTITRKTLINNNINDKKIANFILYGKDLDVFKPRNKLYLRKRYNLPCYSIIILYTGRLCQIKRLDFLLDYFSKLIKHYSFFHLLIVGNGPEKDKLVNTSKKLNIENKVTFIDYCNQDKIKYIYSLADIFVLISSGEGLSSSLLEACSSGLPIIATDVGANRDIVKNGVNGFILSELTYNMFKKSIINLADNLDYYSHNSRQYAQENFKWDIIINNYLNLYGKHE